MSFNIIEITKCNLTGLSSLVLLLLLLLMHVLLLLLLLLLVHCHIVVVFLPLLLILRPLSSLMVDLGRLLILWWRGCLINKKSLSTLKQYRKLIVNCNYIWWRFRRQGRAVFWWFRWKRRRIHGMNSS